MSGRLLSQLSVSFAWVLLAAIPAQATVLAAWDLDEVQRHAHTVVVGTVESSRTVVVREAEGEAWWRETDIKIERQLRGDPISVCTVSQIGGKIGDVERGIAGDVRLRPGQRVLLMLERVSSGRFMIVGLTLGAWTLDADGERLRQHIEQPLMGPDGALLPAPGERLITMERILEVLHGGAR